MSSYSLRIGFKDWETIFVYGHPRGKQFHDYFHAKANDVRDIITGHPCPKPEGWANWLITKCSFNNDLILDPFLGSGTTAFCAKKLGRKCIGIEIEEKYCEIAAKRCSQSVMSLETPPTKVEVQDEFIYDDALPPNP